MDTKPSDHTFSKRFSQQHLPSPLQQWPLGQLGLHTSSKDITLSIKRDDLIHPKVSGNKWRKLVGNLEHIDKIGAETIISFGGAYSNHLVALATITAKLNIPLVAIIRGEAPAMEKWNPRLRYLQSLQVELFFVSREEYRRRDDPDYQQAWQSRYPNSYVIPEGGSNDAALSGVAAMVNETKTQLQQQNLPAITHWVAPVGSGGTLAGIASAAEANEKVCGVCVLKGAEYLEDRVTTLIKSHNKATNITSEPSFAMSHDFHCGGYAKHNAELLSLVKQATDAGLPIEPVYSGKLFLALSHWLARDRFPAGSHIVFVHTGGVWSEE